MVNTFLPFADFKMCAVCLDDKRLYKQIVECKQILRALRGEVKGYKNHPATKMWKGYEDALSDYMGVMFEEWATRRYKGYIPRFFLNRTYHDINAVAGSMPSWFGRPSFHDSHKARLHQKDPKHYAQFRAFDKGQDYEWE
jgi:hypothetical protein